MQVAVTLPAPPYKFTSDTAKTPIPPCTTESDDVADPTAKSPASVCEAEVDGAKFELPLYTAVKLSGLKDSVLAAVPVSAINAPPLDVRGVVAVAVAVKECPGVPALAGQGLPVMGAVKVLAMEVTLYSCWFRAVFVESPVTRMFCPREKAGDVVVQKMTELFEPIE
jgi:hypothetical protein